MRKKTDQTSVFVQDLTNISKYRQVVNLATTPDMEEFYKIAAVATGGIVSIGLMGYIIFLIMDTLPG